MIQHAARYLLDALQDASDARLDVTYVEIYNESVYDLLASHDTKRAVRWSADRGFYVDGARTVPCRAMDTFHMVSHSFRAVCGKSVMKVIEHGMQTRKVGCHKRNGRSSRSHTIFTIDLHSSVVLTTDRSSGGDDVTFGVGSWREVDVRGFGRE